MVKERFHAELVHLQSHSSPGDIASLITTNRRSTGAMRKYYQAALVVIALVSVVSLLFYRHEYNRLRYVLEVINFFGKPGVKDADQNCGKGIYNTEKLDLRFDSPLPSWLRLNDDLFIYSSYLLNKNKVTAIAFGKARDHLTMNCDVFFDAKDPIRGNFNYIAISNSSKIRSDQNFEYIGYQFTCEYPGPSNPEGVSFFNEKNYLDKQNPVLNVKDSPQSLMTDDMALCVAPPLNRSISHIDMISFLNFHQIIGVGHFVIYDRGIPSTFTETVKDIISSQGLNFTFSVIPWNFPFNGIPRDIETGLIEMDCLRRMYNKVKYSATLYWEEYMVLKYHHTLLELLIDFEKSNILSSESYRVDTSVFCTQQKDDEQTVDTAPMIFRKTRRVSQDSIKSRYINISKPHKSLNTGNTGAKKAGGDLINVNHYQYCSDPENKLSYTHDRSILRFAENMIDAPIYKQYIIKRNSSNK